MSLLRRGVVSGGDLDETATLLRAAFAAEASVLNQGMTPFGGVHRSDHVPGEWLRAYAEVAHHDPVPAWLRRTQPGAVFQADLGTGHPDLVDAFLEHGWSDVAVTLLPSPLGEPIALALYRRKGRFDARELDELAALQPLLAEALATRSALAAITAPRSEPMEQALRRVITHATVGLPGLVCHFAEDAAARLGARVGRTLTGADLARLEPVLAAVVARRHRGRRHRFVHGLHAEIAWVAPGQGETQRALVLILDDATPPLDEQAPVLFALSPRQREVALAVAAGSSIPQVARALHISPETARTHYEAALDLLGVPDRTALARLLAR
jgi:DNA-binding CsgD family transcriptional regulator